MRSFTGLVPMGTIDALIGTGDINLLGSPVLRNVIIQERSRMAALEAGFSDIGLMIRDAQLLRLREMERVRTAHGLGPGPIPTSAIRTSPDLIAGYAAHRTALSNQAGLMESLRAAAERVRQAILEVGQY